MPIINWASPKFVFAGIVLFLEKMFIFAAKCIAMEKEEQKKTNFFIKLLEDKKAMRECIQKGGDVDKTAKEHGIKLATPL